MEILIQAAEQLPPQIQALAQLAAKEGYEPLTRLIEEYQSGKNRFDQKGEVLLLAYDQDQLIACGGLNQQWGENEIEARIGRVRRFYVHPKYRKSGVGRQLLAHLEKCARPNFSALCLNYRRFIRSQFLSKAKLCFCGKSPEL